MKIGILIKTEPGKINEHDSKKKYNWFLAATVPVSLYPNSKPLVPD
jgi:hypothetical protein